MILIADSGSTKTNWALIDAKHPVQTGATGGINPFFMDEKGISSLLEREFTLPKTDLSAVYFYGAGCRADQTAVVYKALQTYFQKDNIEVQSDLVAAARSLCRNQAGIVCILGTGSNSCRYDGKKIVQQVPPLGFILGDEGSGASLGKKFIGKLLKNQLSKDIADDFYQQYALTAEEILNKVYRDPFPNRFLAQFAPFIAAHVAEPEIRQLVETDFTAFVEQNIRQYTETAHLPIHFTGSIAFHFQAVLADVLHKYSFVLGKVNKDPMPGLIEYHTEYDNKY